MWRSKRARRARFEQVGACLFVRHAAQDDGVASCSAAQHALAAPSLHAIEARAGGAAAAAGARQFGRSQPYPAAGSRWCTRLLHFADAVTKPALCDGTAGAGLAARRA